MRTRLDAVLGRLGVDSGQFRALLGAFVRMDFRGQHYASAYMTKPGHLVSPLFWVIAQCLFLSTVSSLVMFMRVDVFFFALVHLAGSILVMAAAVLVEFQEVALNEADLEIIAHRPVSPRTYAAARFANLFMYVGLIWLAMNLAPTLLGAGLRDAGPWFVPAYLLASLACSLTAAAAVLFLLTLGKNTGRLAKWQELLAWMQILLLLITFYGGQMILRDDAHAFLLWGAFPPEWVGLQPVGWLARFVEAAAHGELTGLRLGWSLSAMVAIPLLACGLTLARLTGRYREMQPALRGNVTRVMAVQRVGGLAGGRFDWLLPTPAERVGFWLCGKLLARETGVFIRCLFPFNMAIAAVIVGVVSGQFANPLAEHDPALVLLPITAIYLIALSVPPILYTLAQSRDGAAAWIFGCAPLESPGGLAIGACKAVMIWIVGPLCLGFGVVAVVVWRDPLSALLHMALAWGSAWLAGLATLAVIVRERPFSEPAGRVGNLAPLALPLAAFFVASLSVAGLHYLLASSFWFWLNMGLVIVVAQIPLRRAAEKRLSRAWGGGA